MEGYIPPADAASPGSESNQLREQTTPGQQPVFRATPGEVYATTRPSTTDHNFNNPDPRRDTFSNEDVIAGQLDFLTRQRDSVTSSTRHIRNVLDMSDPAHSAPGSDFLLAAEYVVGGNMYDVGEVLDANSFPELEQERNLRIADILRNMHQQRNPPQSFIPKIAPTNRPSVGMTRDSLVRQENLRLWKEEIFNASFYYTGEPDDPVRLGVNKLRMADGRVFRKDRSVDQRFVTLHIDTIIRDTAATVSSRRLSRPLRLEESDDSVSTPLEQRETAPVTRGREKLPTAVDNFSVLSGGSDGNDEKSSSVLPETADPLHRNKPMPSPVQLHGSEWILRVEMRSTKIDRTSLPQPLDVSAFHNHTVVEEGTRIDKKTPFLKGPSNRYPFKSVSVRSYRIMLTDLVAHWCRGPTADQNVYLFACWDSDFQNDFIRRWRAQCSAALSHPHRQDGRYIETYQKYTAAQFGAMSAINLVHLVYICLLPLRKGKEGQAHECMFTAVKEVVNDEIGYLVERYTAYMKNGIIDFLSNYNIVTEAIFLAMSEIEYAIRVYEWWMNVGWFDVFPAGESASRSQCFTHILDAALTKASTPQFDLYGLWHHWDVKLALRTARPRHVSTYLAAKRSKQQLQQAYFEPLHTFLPSLLNLPKPPYTVRDQNPRTDVGRDRIFQKNTADDARPFRTPRPTPDKSHTSRFNNMSADGGLLDETQVDITATDTDTTSTETDGEPSSSVTQTTSTLSPVSVDLEAPEVIARLAALVSSHMKMDAVGTSKYTSPSSSPWSSSATPVKETDRVPRDKTACYNVLVAGKCNRSDTECRYSHDQKVITEAKTQCMARWKSGQKTPFSNLSVLDRYFPRQDGIDDPTGYSDDSRESVYQYFDSVADSAANSNY